MEEKYFSFCFASSSRCHLRPRWQDHILRDCFLDRPTLTLPKTTICLSPLLVLPPWLKVSIKDDIPGKKKTHDENREYWSWMFLLLARGNRGSYNSKTRRTSHISLIFCREGKRWNTQCGATSTTNNICWSCVKKYRSCLLFIFIYIYTHTHICTHNPPTQWV